MNFSKQFIEQIKKQTNLKQLVEELVKNIEWIHYSNNTLGARCPHPKHTDNDPSFRLWEETQSWACMTCHAGKKNNEKTTRQNDVNYGSDCIAFLMWLKGYTYPKAVRFLAERLNIPLPEEDQESLAQLKLNQDLALSYNSGLITSAKDYLLNRGLTDESIKKWSLGWCLDRVTFPLINQYDQVVGFTRRLLNYDKSMTAPKYRNSKTSKIFNKSKYMYGEHLIDKHYKYVFITEGPMDVILPHQFGVMNVVASLGTAFTEGHAEFIKKTGLTPVVVMDGDEKGIEALHKVAGLLNAEGLAFLVVELPDGKDLAEFTLTHKERTYDALEKLMKPYSIYCLQDVLAAYDAKVQQLKMDLYPEVMRAANYIKHPEERALMTDLLYDKMKITLR